MNRRKFLGGLAAMVAGAGALLVGGRKIEDDPHGDVTITGLTADQPYTVTIHPAADHDHDGVNSYKRRPLKGRQMTVWWMDESGEVPDADKWKHIYAQVKYHDHR